jgi:hypothetical protein
MMARNIEPFMRYVSKRALLDKKHFCALRGVDAKPSIARMNVNGNVRKVWTPGAVVMNATATLLRPGKLVKLPPKPGKGVRWRMKPVALVDLLPPALRAKMLRPLPAPIGNLQLHKSPLESPRWVALERVYAQLFELSPIWDVTGAERNKLIDKAVSNERKKYITATSVSGGPSKNAKGDTDAALQRYTESGQAFATEPSRLAEQDAQLET